MTEDEARDIIAIMRAADSGCDTCATKLIRLFLRAHPEFEVVVDGQVLEPADAEEYLRAAFCPAFDDVFVRRVT